jgi:hypothetical protein
MARLTPLYIGLAACLLTAAPASAQLYKWVDDKGVTNYSNEPPPKSRTRKPATIVEDTISVYTPEKSVTEELERRAQQKTAAPPPPPPPGSAPQQPRVTSTAPPPPIAYDPCMTQNDPNCQIVHDGPPVIYGRRRPPPVLNQPQIPPGTIAGQATQQGGYIAGQSASAPPATPQTARPAGQPNASFTLKPSPRDPDPSRDSRR